MSLITKDAHILRTAEKLIAQHGYEGTSTRMIAAAAGVNISMISYYFGSKESLLEAIFQARMSEGFNFSNQILNDGHRTVWEKVIAIVEMHVERVVSLGDFFRIVQAEQLQNKNENILKMIETYKIGMLEALDTLMKEGRSTGQFTREVDTAWLHATIVGTTFNAQNNWKIYQDFIRDKSHYIENLKQHLISLVKCMTGYEKD